jgi:uncharacterized protein (TIRG00374 family)
MKEGEKNNHIFKIVFSLAFMLIIIYYFLGKNPDSVIRDLKLVDYRFVILSFIFGGWAYVNRGLRWIVLIDALGYKSSKLNSVAAVSVGYLTNLFIPRAGEISRCTTLNQVEKVPVDKLFGTILVERVIDFIMLIIIMLISVLLKSGEIIRSFNEYQKIEREPSNTKFIFLGSLLFIGILIYLLQDKIKNAPFYNKVSQFIEGLKEGFKSIKKIKNKNSFWLHTLSIWTMYFLMTYICFQCIEETSHLTISDGLFLLFLGGIGMAIPTPGGIGSYHLMVMIGLVALQIPNGFVSIEKYNEYNPAMLFPIIIWFAQSLVAIVMGSIGMLVLFLSKKKSNVAS